MDRDRFFDLSLDLLVVAGTDGLFRRVNPAFERVLGWTAEEAVATPYLELIHPDDVAAARLEVEKLARGIPTTRFECRFRCKAGVYRWFAWTCAPAEDGTLYAIGRDITEERALREAADRANEELEAFSYAVSHDLRAPVRAIDGFARILTEDHGDGLDAEARRVVAVIQRNTRHMGRLIDDLLQFTRLGRRDLTMRRVDMTALAQSAATEVLAGTTREVDLMIEPLPRAVGDAALLRQVWLNLLGNAVKFTAEKPASVICVRGEPGPDGVVTYCVEDNGVGFDMRYADKLFRVFERLHVEHGGDSTGVGLALVRRIVERHGGRAWAEGKVGEGATFWFSLPSLKGAGHGPGS